MNALLRSWAAPSACLLALGLLAPACGEDKKAPPTEDAGAETGPQKPVLGGKLGAAVKAAESAQAAAEAKGGQDGPPEAGIFAPGAADKVLAAGAPVKVELLGEGSDPKVSLAYAPGDDEQREAVSVRLQGGGIPVDYALAFKVDRPKADKGKDDKKPDAAGVRVVARLVGLSFSPQIPKELADQVGKLKGSEIRYLMSPQGAITDASYTLAKGADPALEQVLHPLVEAIGLVTTPLPAKPVGVGAYWMATDRLNSLVVDVLRYRVFRVEKIEKDRASLSVDVRQYAAKADIDAGNGQKLTGQQFESLGKGKVEWTASGLLPVRAEALTKMAMQGSVQGAPQGQGGARLQTELAVKMAAADAKK